MAIKLTVKLQRPTIELVVKAKDSAGDKDSFKAGFKRYTYAETQTKFKELQAISLEANEGDDKSDDLIKNEIVYLKDVKLEIEENGVTKDLHVADTRTAKPIPTLWETSEECLAVLLDVFLNSAPYRVGLLEASTKALINNDYSSAEVKN